MGEDRVMGALKGGYRRKTGGPFADPLPEGEGDPP